MNATTVDRIKGTAYHLSGLSFFCAGLLGIVVLFGLFSAPARAEPPFTHPGTTGGSPTPIGPAAGSPSNLELPSVAQNRVVYDIVDSSLRVTAYDNIRIGLAALRGGIEDLITNDAPADLRFVIFNDTSQIDSLSTGARNVLLLGFETGRVCIGAGGFGKDLKQKLGLLDPALADSPASTGGDGLWVVLHRNPAGHVNELIIAAPTPERSSFYSLADAVMSMRSWFRRNEGTDHTLADGDSPWQALDNYEWSGETMATFKGDNEQAGTYKFTLSPYTVASNQNNDDWYRVDFQTISEITFYEMTGDRFGDTNGHCGWWTESMHAAATVTTPGGQWWDYMPSSTVGSTTTGFTIGGNITTTQAGVNAAYSQSYGQPDVTITVAANSVDQAIDWAASLVGCGNYSDFPDYSGASSVARSTYDLNPSFIIAVPTGSKMSITTTAPDPNNVEPWRFTVRKDYVEICNLVEVCTTEYTQTYNINTNITCTQGGCN